ncbi:MAG: AbrB family transcriptional regulator [Lachnospirales bacterium]
MINVLLTLLFAFIFGYILQKLKIAGGMMIGAIIGSALFNIVFTMGFMPNYTKFFAQAIAGTYIGCSINKSDLQELKSVLKPLLFVITTFLITCLSVGTIIYFISDLDPATAYMSAVPGGMTDIPIIAIDFGANPSKVVTMQFARLVTGIGILPTIIKNFDKSTKTTIVTSSETNVKNEYTKEKK